MIKKLLLILALTISVFMSSGASTFADSYLPSGWHNNVKEAGLKDKGDGDAVDIVGDFVINTVLPIAKTIIMAVAILLAIIMILHLSLSRGEEDVITEFKVKVGFLILGLLLVGLAQPIGDVFNPAGSDGAVKQLGGAGKLGESFWAVAEKVIESATIFIGGVAVVLMAISGLRIIVSKGDDTIIEEQKRNFVYTFVGLIVILTIKTFIIDVVYINFGQSPGLDTVDTASKELLGIIAYALQYLVLAGVGLFILAGIYYVFSMGEEDSANKAKTTMKNTLIGIFVVMLSYTIVATFIPN